MARADSPCSLRNSFDSSSSLRPSSPAVHSGGGSVGGSHGGGHGGSSGSCEGLANGSSDRLSPLRSCHSSHETTMRDPAIADALEEVAPCSASADSASMSRASPVTARPEGEEAADGHAATVASGRGHQTPAAPLMAYGQEASSSPFGAVWARADEDAAASDADWLTEGEEEEDEEEEGGGNEEGHTEDDDDERAAGGPLLLWSGALDCQLPSLGPGESHEHMLTVGCGQMGVYRLVAHARATTDGSELAASFVDMEVP